MLEALVEGRESSEIVLIEDSVEERGRWLAKSFASHLASRCERVIVCSFDVTPDEWLSENLLASGKFSTFGYSDASSWKSEKQIDFEAILRNEMIGCKSCSIIFDPLSWLLSRHSTSSVCRMLQKLKRGDDRFKSMQIVALVHSDLHDERTLASLRYMASSLVQISGDDTKREARQHCQITHKKKKGKVTKSFEKCSVDETWKVTSSVISKKDRLEPDAQSTDSDPTANLTFNLRLSDEEKRARSRVILPYLEHQGGKSGPQIFYEADDGDDFDEEDPDDDLDI